MQDSRKSGGRYENVSGIITKIDKTERIIILCNGMMISMDYIYDIKVNSNSGTYSRGGASIL